MGTSDTWICPPQTPTNICRNRFGCCDVDDVLVKSQTIPTKLTQAQNTATLIAAPAKTEFAIDNNQFSLTSGLTESMWHLSELETISDSSLQVVNVRSIPETVSQAVLSCDEDNTHSMSIHPPTSLMMSSSVPSEMPLAMPTPDGSNPPPYANVAAYVIPGNDNGILTSGTVTPRQLQQVPDTSTALSVQDHTHTNYRHLSTLTFEFVS